MHPTRNAGAHGGAAALSCDDISSLSELLLFDIPSQCAKSYFQLASSPVEGARYSNGEQGVYKPKEKVSASLLGKSCEIVCFSIGRLFSILPLFTDNLSKFNGG